MAPSLVMIIVLKTKKTLSAGLWAPYNYHEIYKTHR